MLHCTMKRLSDTLRTGLEDVLAQLRHARRSDDLSRLASICFTDARRWALLAGHRGLAARAGAIVLDRPHASRASLQDRIDSLVADLEELYREETEVAARRPDHRRGSGATLIPGTASADDPRGGGAISSWWYASS
jgi:hypothetical protein